jgi:hypothetical protein
LQGGWHKTRFSMVSGAPRELAMRCSKLGARAEFGSALKSIGAPHGQQRPPSRLRSSSTRAFVLVAEANAETLRVT